MSRFEDIPFTLLPVRREDGLAAVGGDLGVEQLLTAYRMGIFPWARMPAPMWFSPDPRTVLFPLDFHWSKSLLRTDRTTPWTIRFDGDFPAVIRACAGVSRRHESGTWIDEAFQTGYIALHEAGWAHSVEVRDAEDRLVGGLYGVSLGGVFYGESMFSRERDASKLALGRLCRRLGSWGFDLVDCQARTEHLMSLGATEIPRREFEARLEKALRKKDRPGSWAGEPPL